MQYIFLFWHVHAELAFGFTFFLFLIDKNHSVRYLFGNYFVRDHSDSIVLIISGNARKHVTSLAISLIVRYWLHVCARYILLSSRFVVCFVLKYYFVLVQAIKNDYHDLNSVSFVSTKWNEERYLSTCSFYRGWRI